MNEDTKKDDVTPSPSEETTQAKDQETETKPQDIDFEKEAEELEKKAPKKRTPQEEIEYNLKKIADRAKEAGVDPLKVLGSKSKDEEPDAEVSQFATKRDLAIMEAKKLAGSDGELKVIMHWVDRGLSVEDAHYMANKGRVKGVLDEIIRGKTKPPQGSGESAGQKQKANTAPELSRAEHSTLLSRGYKLIKPGLYQAKFNQQRYDPETGKWVSERIQK